MPQKLAVAIVHGIGSQKENFADEMIQLLTKRFAKRVADHTDDPVSQVVFKPVYWASVFEKEENLLWDRLKKGGEMDYTALRLFVINYLADAIAYQPTIERHHNYDNVHQVFAESLRFLSETAGETAPLCVISHSLGSVIASNYFYDLQYQPERIRHAVRVEMTDTPIEQGNTLAQLYTLGSALALWSLRYENFGNAIQVPAPKLSAFYPNLEGGWWNIYDKDDVLGFPLKSLNSQYHKAVTEDIVINAGGLFTSWNPLSHSQYGSDSDVIEPIADRLAEMWFTINNRNS
ncbi:MAG TPA: chemotaxis protein [Bacillales bacterium]|nr:chemotaxis protein [Bacillales bacterium]